MSATTASTTARPSTTRRTSPGTTSSSRARTSFAANLSGTSEVYIVAVVREGYVPTGTLEEVVEAMSAIPGMKPLASADAEYDYDVKPNTRSTVEMMTVRFVKGRKR